MPDIGALIFHINPEAKKKGLDAIAFSKLLYRLPAPQANKFQVGRKLPKSA
jgi:hypothetical protein